MPIRYRRLGDEQRVAREGEAADVAELEALAAIGTVSANDDVALDGVHFRKAGELPELKGVFPKSGGSLGLGGKLLLIAGVGVVGLVALGIVIRLATVSLTIGAVVAAGLGVVWLIRRLKR